MVLRLKLLSKEALPLLGGPENLSQFFGARAGVNSIKELVVTVARNATGD
jgi:hypothetical protein